MDPRQNLQEQLELANSLLAAFERDDDEDLNQNDAARLKALEWQRKCDEWWKTRESAKGEKG